MCEKASDNKISLHGGEVCITKDNSNTFFVERGTVLVYLVPLGEDGSHGKRFLIYEAAEGETIPAFYRKADDAVWSFCLIALDTAQIRECPDSKTDELENNFAKRAGLRNIGEKSYEELLIEVYNRNSVKEEGYIYANQREKEVVRDKGLRLIYRLFDKSAVKYHTPESGNLLYDAAACVCDRAHIKIASVDRVVSSAGRRFRLEDISRVSNFISREVLLEEGWIKKDSGCMVGFLRDGHRAVALLPRGNGGYMAYLPHKHIKIRVTSKFEKELEGKAYAFYPPFPNKKMSLWEMLVFGFRETNAGDWIRFCVFTLFGTLIGILLPMLSEQIYDNYIPMGSAGGIMQICMVLLACNIGNLSFTIVKNMSALR